MERVACLRRPIARTLRMYVSNFYLDMFVMTLKKIKLV